MENQNFIGSVSAEQFGGGLAMATIVVLLFAWQHKGDSSRCKNWLGYGALFIELLAAGLAISWAVNQGKGVLVVLFGLGFIGLALSKATTAGALVYNYRSGNTPAVVVGGVTLLGIYAAVYLAGVFGGQHDTVSKTTAAALASAPVQAVESQLEVARAKLAELSGFADSTRAETESQAASQEAASIEAERRKLSAELGAARGELGACRPDYVTKCIRPMTAKVERLQAALNALPASQVSTYASKHAEYTGLQQHIAELETKRAKLLESNGAAMVSAAGADDRLITWITGYEGEKAAGFKWLAFVLAFDLLSLGLRIFSELQGSESNKTAQAVKKYKALIDAGYNPSQAASLMAVNYDEFKKEPEEPKQEKGIIEKFGESFGRGAAQVASAGSPSRLAPVDYFGYGSQPTVTYEKQSEPATVQNRTGRKPDGGSNLHHKLATVVMLVSMGFDTKAKLKAAKKDRSLFGGDNFTCGDVQLLEFMNQAKKLLGEK